jgi:putative tryptophan/tyrosine transport system substrate-binding protein
MQRIGLAVVLTLDLTFAPLSADAQPAGKITRIGVLCQNRSEGAAYEAFRAGLRDVGWVEGRNLVIEARGAGGQLDRLPERARELVASSRPCDKS